MLATMPQVSQFPANSLLLGGKIGISTTWHLLGVFNNRLKGPCTGPSCLLLLGKSQVLGTARAHGFALASRPAACGMQYTASNPYLVETAC